MDAAVSTKRKYDDAPRFEDPKKGARKAEIPAQQAVETETPLERDVALSGPGESSETTSSNSHQYTSLSRTANQCRFLRILPHYNPTAELECELVTKPWSESVRYSALSYVWGPPHVTKEIQVDGKSYHVTENLHAAMLQLRAMDMESGSWYRLWWIDAICIDQGNLDEHGHQVNFMARIYRRALAVVVWLGDEIGGTAAAFEAIRKRELRDQSVNADSLRGSLMDIMRRPWFRRIWGGNIPVYGRTFLLTSERRFSRKLRQLEVLSSHVGSTE